MDAHDSVRTIVKSILSEIAGDRGLALCADRVAKGIIARIKEAYADEYDPRTASTLAMHLSDWNADAAFIVAMHLCPERFTNEEIGAGIGLFLCHAPNHIRAACKITGNYVWEDFPESEPDLWENAP